MSRQISFLHTEADAVRFLETIEALGGTILYQGMPHLPTQLADVITEQMASHTCQFYLLPGMVEFSNCCKGNPLSRTYEVGRLYCTADDAETLTFFKKLRAHIRKTYLYSKASRVYFSPAFKAQYDRKYYFGIHSGVQPVRF